jgi:hypothetical protein
VKVGIIGTGKRFKSMYLRILKVMNCQVYAWNRTIEKVNELEPDGVTVVKELKDIKKLDLNVCLCFLPPDKSFDLLKDLDLECPLLLETPILDQRWIEKDNVGVLEQWIYLPVELAKEELYKSGVLKRPYWIFNDGRSFEYHAIAQLRKYCNHDKPVNYFGKFQNIENSLGFIDKQDKLNTTPDSWLHGTVQLSTGTVLMYSFAYNCKQTNLKTFQLLRACSEDGSITSGRSNEMDNDYEMLEVRYLNDKREVIVEKLEREITDEGCTKSIFGKRLGTIWKNRYLENNFNDQEIAIASMIEDAARGNIYPSLEGFMDNLVMAGMKHSASNNILVGYK